MEESIPQQIPQQEPITPKWWTKNITIICAFLLVLLITIGVIILLVFHTKKTQFSESKNNVGTAGQTNNVESTTGTQSQIQQKEITGKIIYVNKRGELSSLDLKTGKVTDLFHIGGYDWQYKNGYVFSASTSSIMRYSLQTGKVDTVPVANIGAPQINPSPDGEKVYVYNAPGYPGDRTPAQVFVYNFITHQTLQFPTGRWGDSWVGDSKHMVTDSLSSLPAARVFDGAYSAPRKLFMWDVSTNTFTQFAEGTLRGLTTYPTAPTVSWQLYNGNQFPTAPYNPSVSDQFPTFYSMTLNPDGTIGKILDVAGANMSIPKDYFTGISAAILGKPNEFYLTVDNKSLSVYYTNSQDIFKRISPDNDFSYRAVAYNPTFDSILAFKFSKKMFPVNIPPSQVRGYQYKPYLVLLDKNGLEKVITKLEGFLPNTTAIFSPDGQFILAPKYSDQMTNTEYTIFSVMHPQKMKAITQELGNKFYWVK